MAFLTQISNQTHTPLKPVDDASIKDRSNANVSLAGKDVLDDEAERWQYFFDSGVSSWFEDIKEVTFTSTFCTLTPIEAQVIVDHWEARRSRLAATHDSNDDNDDDDDSSRQLQLDLQDLVQEATFKLSNLMKRLNVAVDAETKLSSVNKAFVKLSTRSPKDSKKALERAKVEYQRRVDELGGASSVDDNDRWRILCEETTRSSAVSNGAQALELLLDSDRVYEDLEYALRGPPESWIQEQGTSSTTESSSSSSSSSSTLGKEKTLAWNMSLVARAWDPRLRPESEFRGICWNNELTCLCQYFHPLLFPELASLREQILSDIQTAFSNESVRRAVNRLGGHCILDFAWLGPGDVIIVELNPFDGVCLGTFPASTGLFLWDKPVDQQVMKGETEFEFRLREIPLSKSELKNNCNSAWREIIYNSSSSSTGGKE